MDIKWIQSDNEIKTVLHRSGDLVWMSHKVLDEYPWLINGSATRFGGVSTGHLSSLNLSFEQGDDPDNVRTNRRRIAAAIGFDASDIICGRQEHTTNVVRVTRADCGRALDGEPYFTAVDGYVTDEPGVVLSVFYADCVPLYFVDTVHRAVGASHSGWRGTANWMAAVTVEKMRAEFGSDPADLKVVIGNCICRSCYTVNGDVALLFPESCYTELGNDQYKMDLPRANFEILMRAGVREENISMPDLCTCCNPDLLFSHRASKGRRGTLAGFIGIRKKMTKGPSPCHPHP